MAIVLKIQRANSTYSLRLQLLHSKFERNWWFDCHECHLESFVVWYNTEDSFIIGVAYGKKWEGLRSLKALEFEKWGGVLYHFT